MYSARRTRSHDSSSADPRDWGVGLGLDPTVIRVESTSDSDADKDRDNQVTWLGHVHVSWPDVLRHGAQRFVVAIGYAMAIGITMALLGVSGWSFGMTWAYVACITAPVTRYQKTTWCLLIAALMIYRVSRFLH